MEAYQASPEMTKVVNSSPFLMPSAKNTLQPIDSTSGNWGLARERLSLELAREKAASLQAKQKPPKRDGSVTAAAVGASLGAGLGIVMAVIMGAASALRKP
ncbi:hypothetical protein EJB05_21660, partial [Eragrostis curvula]